MRKYPAIVKLSQKSADQNLYEGEIVDGLNQNDDIVHFVKKFVTDIHTMHCHNDH